MDKLETVFKLQDGLNGRFGRSQEQMIPEGNNFNPVELNKFCDAQIAELIEIKEALGPHYGYKVWKDKSKDLEGLREECIDQFFFSISILLAAGMDAEMAFKEYTEKYKKNTNRDDWQEGL